MKNNYVFGISQLNGLCQHFFNEYDFYKVVYGI